MKKSIKLLLPFIFIIIMLSTLFYYQKSNKKWKENPILDKYAYKNILDMQQPTTFKNNAEAQMYISSIESSAPLNLTQQQKEEDFNFMWDTIQDKVFCLSEIAFSKNVQLDSHISDYREKAIQSKDDKEFYQVLQDSIKEFNMIWHISLWSPYSSLGLAAGAVSEGGSDMLSESEPLSKQNLIKLKYWDSLLSTDPLYQMSKTYQNENSQYPALEILEKNKIAKISLPTMLYDADYEKASAALVSLMKQVANYPNVIFDLKGNSGGDGRMWMDQLVAPNIDEKLVFENKMYLNYTEDMKRRLHDQKSDKEQAIVSTYSATITMPPQSLNNAKEANVNYGNADAYIENRYEIFQRFNRKLLKGKLWVLTYPENYSSADAFAAFCKDTGFAVLVGSVTSGDGLTTPMRYALPNSGLMAMVTYRFGFNEDNTNNSLEGTKPDIPLAKEESPSEACLKAIGNLP